MISSTTAWLAGRIFRKGLAELQCVPTHWRCCVCIRLVVVLHPLCFVLHLSPTISYYCIDHELEFVMLQPIYLLKVSCTLRIYRLNLLHAMFFIIITLFGILVTCLQSCSSSLAIAFCMLQCSLTVAFCMAQCSLTIHNVIIR